MPEFGLGDIKAAVACFANPPAPIDFLPDQEKFRSHQPHFFDGLFFNEESAAAGIVDVADIFPFLFKVGIGTSMVIAAHCMEVDISAGMPDYRGVVIEKDLGPESCCLGVGYGSVGKSANQVRRGC